MGLIVPVALELQAHKLIEIAGNAGNPAEDNVLVGIALHRSSWFEVTVTYK